MRSKQISTTFEIFKQTKIVKNSKLKPKLAFYRDLAYLAGKVKGKYKRTCGKKFFNMQHVQVICGRKPHKDEWHRELSFEHEDYPGILKARKKYWRQYKIGRV